ncbi:peptidase M50 [Halobacteriales archaeon QS_1_68_20]|nr:MAG: peptidase M50 [Halobacteriales archaeon QS_1_68_20]
MERGTEDRRDRFDGLQRRVEALERRLNAALPRPLKVGAGVLYLHTTRGSDRLDALADRPCWVRWGDLAIALTLAVQAAALALVTAGAVVALGRDRATALNEPANTVAIPGLNEFIPVAAAGYVVAALVAATVVHEGGHAVACRRAGVPVREWGVALLFGVVPLAAYVLTGDELDDAPRRARLRVYAAAVANNLVLAGVAFLVLLAPVTASPMDAYLTYFGWALTGGGPPTPAAVAALGPVTNLAFWTALLSANVGLLNALPVSVLDGGRVRSLSLAALADRADAPLSGRTRRAVVNAAGAFAVVAVVLAVFGPLLPV